MKTEDENLNEHAPAGSPKVHPTRDDMKLAAPRGNLYPAWKQARCIWCKAGELFVGGARFGIRHRLNAGPSGFQYVDCTAPSADEYIAELEGNAERVRATVLAECAMLRRQIARIEDRYRWRPISEIHEDYGDCVLVNVADCGYMQIGSNLDVDFVESLWTHFTRFAPIGQEEYERMKAEAESVSAVMEAERQESGPASSPST